MAPKPYTGVFVDKFLEQLTDMQLLQLANDLARYPEDREHHLQVQQHIKQRLTEITGIKNG